MSSATLLDVAQLVLAGEPRLGGIRMVAVDGPSGSGKTTFAGNLASAIAECAPDLRCQVFATDVLATWSEPFNWWNRFESQVLQPLAAGRNGRIQINDWSGPAPVLGDWIDVPVPQILIVEGVSSSRRAVADRLTTAIWVELADPTVRLERSVARDGEASRRYLEQWQRDEGGWFATDAPRDRADIIIQAQ